jgi:hypothetical protein
VHHLLRKHRRPVSELIAELRADIDLARAVDADRTDRLTAADRALCSALAEGKIAVFGRRGRASDGFFFRGQHEPVPPPFFLHQHRGLDLWGWATIRSTPDVPMDEWLHWRPTTDDPDYGDLQIAKAALQRRFAPQAAAAVVSEDVSPAAAGLQTTSLTPRRRDKGGRRERNDWALFDREMLRRASLDSGDSSLRAFKREMKDWAALNMDPVPDDRTIDRRINARACREMFSEE